MDTHAKAHKTNAAPAAQAFAPSEVPDNVNKIREIIFGTQMRDYERRFDEVSSRFAVEMGRFKSELELRLDRLESLMRKDVEDTVKKLQQEKRDRSDAVEEVNKSLQDARKSLNERLSNLDEDVAKSTSTLRNEFHTQGNELVQRLNLALEALTNRLNNDLTILRTDKVARHDLGEMLAELGLRLKGEFELPTAK